MDGSLQASGERVHVEYSNEQLSAEAPPVVLGIVESNYFLLG